MTTSKFTSTLAAINVLWAGAAWWHDWPLLANAPLLLWPLLLICPLYPLLLAAHWWLATRGRRFWLTPLAALGSAVFGVVALLYYPLFMVKDGFDWAAALMPLFVAAYSLQGWWLLRHALLLPIQLLVAAGWLLLVWFTHWRGYSFGLFDTAWLAAGYDSFFLAAAALTIGVAVAAIKVRGGRQLAPAAPSQGG